MMKAKLRPTFSLTLAILLSFTVEPLTGAPKTEALARFKRQALSNNPIGFFPSSTQAISTSTEASSQDGGTAINGPDERSQEETLSSLKCDFGTSDAPDLCKFRIIDPLADSPTSKGLATWNHGSGKLALYQGGPLIDASERNDTNGGYIYYETSNPHASQMMTGGNNMTGNSNSPSMTGRVRQPNYDYSYSSLGPADYQQQVSPSQKMVAKIGSKSSNMITEPTFVTPNLTAPGPTGMCLSFRYAIKGLSTDELQIYVNDLKTERIRKIWASSESAAGNWSLAEVLYSATNQHTISFSASRPASWQVDGISKDLQQQHKFRGHIALDEIDINRHDPTSSESAGCRGHCNFDGDLCGWTNAENGQEDDFDWTFGRGSENLFTGPARDFVSSNNNEITGSYLSIESNYPRRPGDRAILLSPVFQATPVNDALCMRVAVHMFGSGIGSLAIKIRYLDEGSAPVAPPSNTQPPGNNQQAQSSSPTQGQSVAVASPSARFESSAKATSEADLVIWEMSGDAGNNWHQAQTSLSSSRGPFQVIIEGVVGENHLGNIAIDEISFSRNPCPTSPPIASKNYGDCTFEQSMCYWRNPDSNMHIDDLDWIWTAEEQTIHGPNFDHTIKKKSGHYLKLQNTFKEPKSGTRAFLLSPIFQPKASVQCISFYYYMFMRSISSSGPNLGTVRIYLASNNELIPIWRLTNPISSPSWKQGRVSLSTLLIEGQPAAPTKMFQIAIEAVWGDTSGGAIALDDITVFDGACEIMPPEAKSVPGECTFDVDMCTWTNKTSDAFLPLVDPMGNSDGQPSPFIQYVSGAASSTPNNPYKKNGSNGNIRSVKANWQLATVNSRPVNLQDHTYKAPIGYVYVDVLDNNPDKMPFSFQSAEMTVPSGQQIRRCLSFWFATFGRQESNQLNIYLTQASVGPPSSETGADQAVLSPLAGGRPASGSPGLAPRQISGPNSSVTNRASNSQASSTSSSSNTGSQAGNQGSGGGSNPTPGESETEENSQAWKSIEGKLIWSAGLKNVTEMNRRKWLYGQVTLKADSNYIVRFIATSTDGGFALDDISFYEGQCETRPSFAKLGDAEDSDSNDSSGAPNGSQNNGKQSP